ncbi:hypothetical protein Q5P01_002364 [Channa striata]|uniref:Uncharacterized protein n=1 Tax=Channa striata TaxID=64152 RepID=A0AA88T3N8_CHASR|nr:hypothetical protein Q5P01_002364 [Channa striata]
MSLYGGFLTDEQFQCSICLDVFTNPSSTPCGHSFCMACISRYWDGLKICQCPLCKKTFQKRPELQINRTLREITEQFRSMGGGADRDKRGGLGGGRGCTTNNFLFDELKRKLHRPQQKPRMVMNCDAYFQGESTPKSSSPVTTSLASSVPNQNPIAASNHTSGIPPPPLFFTRLHGQKRFSVSEATNSQHLPVCELHHRGILIYCRTDRECICPECETEDHPDHDTVTVEDEWMQIKAQLQVSEQEIQDMIRERLMKIKEIRASVSELELAVERETAGSVCLFSAMVSAIECSQAELMEVVEMSRRAAELQANALILQLELEVEELRRRETELTELGQSDNHIHCVKTFPVLSNPPPAKDWSEVSVNSDLGTRSIYRSMAALMKGYQKELKGIAETGFPASVLEPIPLQTQPRAKTVQEYAVDVTLDSSTAHPRLILTEDMKSVRYGDRYQLLPCNPERFDKVVCVLGKEAISSGRHYWEVEVGGKTEWDLGVARQSVVRKGKIEVTPRNGFWFLSLREKSKCAFRSEPSSDVLTHVQPNKIGVFVDFEKGQVSFYNVDAKIHIYTFHDTFTECVYPFFSPCTNKSGKNDRPLVITQVNMTE